MSTQKYSPRFSAWFTSSSEWTMMLTGRAMRGIAQDPVLGDVPVIGDIGQVFVADDDQQIEVGLVAVLRLIDPVVARIAAEQDDLVDLAVALVRLGRARDRLVELLQQDPRTRASSRCWRSGRWSRSVRMCCDPKGSIAI